MNVGVNAYYKPQCVHAAGRKHTHRYMYVYSHMSLRMACGMVTVDNKHLPGQRTTISGLLYVQTCTRPSHFPVCNTEKLPGDEVR